MSDNSFLAYQEKIFEYQYKFFQLAPVEEQRGSKLMSYRYWGDRDYQNKELVGEMSKFPNQLQQEFTINLNLLHPESELETEIDLFKKRILQQAKLAKEEERENRNKASTQEFIKFPPAQWDYIKKNHVDREKAEAQFSNWDRIIEVYRSHQAGFKNKEILDKHDKMYAHLGGNENDPKNPKDPNDPNKFKKIRNEISEAKKLIESTLKGTFPITD